MVWTTKRATQTSFVSCPAPTAMTQTLQACCHTPNPNFQTPHRVKVINLFVHFCHSSNLHGMCWLQASKGTPPPHFSIIDLTSKTSSSGPMENSVEIPKRWRPAFTKYLNKLWRKDHFVYHNPWPENGTLPKVNMEPDSERTILFQPF